MSYSRHGNNNQHQQPDQPMSPAEHERRRKWAQAIDLVWSEMQVEPDWSKRWELMCGSRTTYEMCAKLDQMAEHRWGDDWAHTRQVERAVALEAIRKVNATYWKGAA
jgi:hypothetical protein